MIELVILAAVALVLCVTCLVTGYRTGYADGVDDMALETIRQIETGKFDCQRCKAS